MLVNMAERFADKVTSQDMESSAVKDDLLVANVSQGFKVCVCVCVCVCPRVYSSVPV